MLYLIEPERNPGSMADTVRTRDLLGHSIAVLAADMDEEVFFHSLKDQMLGGGIYILLECSQEFASNVSALTGAGRVSEYSWQHETERNAAIQDYFTRLNPVTFAKPQPPQP